MKKPTKQRNSYHNPFSICLHTGIPNRINTGYLPHHPTQKQNKIILTLTKVQYLPIPSITNIPSINIIIPNTYIKVPHRGFWGFRQTRLGNLNSLYKATQLTI